MEIRGKLHCEVVADLGIPIAGEVEEKQELKNLFKWSKRKFYGRSRNFYIPKKLEIAHFNTTQSSRLSIFKYNNTSCYSWWSRLKLMEPK